MDAVQAFTEVIRNLTSRIHRLEVLETAVSTLAIAYTPFASLGIGQTGQVRMCTNARKGAEGPGAGTGCLVYWNVATASWLRVYDNAAASA
jgi:hypothetical protein